MSQFDNISEVKKTALEITNDIFAIGQKYVKHRRIAAFFTKFFKPHLDKVTLGAPDDDIIQVMTLVKNKIDRTFKQLDIVEQVAEAKEYNDPKIQAQVEKIILKNNVFAPKIDEVKAAKILERLRNG